MGEEEEDVEMVALRAGRHQQHATGGRGGGGQARLIIIGAIEWRLKELLVLDS